MTATNSVPYNKGGLPHVLFSVETEETILAQQDGDSKAIPTVSKGKKRMLTTTAPALLPQEKAGTKEQIRNLQQLLVAFTQYSQDKANGATEFNPPPPGAKQAVSFMFAYMEAMLVAMVTLAQSQGKVSTQTTAMSESMVAESQVQLTKANNDLQKLLKEEWDYDHRSFWDKLVSAFKCFVDIVEIVNPVVTLIKAAADGKSVKDEYKTNVANFCQDNKESGGVFNYLVTAMMILASPFTGGSSLALMGLFSLIMSDGVTGGESALMSAIEKAGPLGLQIFLQVLLAAGEAIALGGVSGIVDSVTENLTADSADTAASVAADAGEAGAADVTEAATTTASSTENTTSSLLRAMQKAFGDSWKQFFKSLAGKTLMQAASTNLWSDAIKGVIEIADKCGAKTGTDTENEAAAIGGAVLGVVAGIAGAYMDCGGNVQNLVKSLEKKLGEKAFQTLKTAMKFATAGFALQQSMYNIQYGLNEKKIGDSTLDLATAQAMQDLYGNVLTIINQLISSNSSVDHSINSDNIAVQSRFNKIAIDPWNAWIQSNN